MAGKSSKFIIEDLKKVVQDKRINRANDELVASASNECTTSEMEMKRLLKCCRLLIKHHKNNFRVPKGSHHLSETFEPNHDSGRLGFYLFLHLLKVGFHLPLHPFICELLKTYNIALK
ncbi:hypothetical protein J1N35_007374 [Gossypium stocksii]|uniref:Uncharacterized protein n=1 Tax=Gossypium stocksii TaxID=47602 RepID=A0A9D3W6J2_9ROSI|nr:hypothetical protein J1N35_007374 [Gossypium stocksii]